MNISVRQGVRADKRHIVKWLEDQSISKKLFISHLITATLGAAVGLIGIACLLFGAGQSNSVLGSILIVVTAIAISYIASFFLYKCISKIICPPIHTFVASGELLAVGDINMGKVLDENAKTLKFRKDEIGLLAASNSKIAVNMIKQAKGTRAIANGDLTTEITVNSDDDVLGKALSELVEKFHTLVTSIVSAADQVDSGAKLVANTSTSLSQGSSRQAESIEKLMSTLEGITTQSVENAQNAQAANGLTQTIKSDAELGNTQMANMLKAMDDISQSSDSIGEIIKVIEDIAFQTNILALNAAVEAARAGQSGKGFAVVAEEVKNLAGKSSRAAKETTELIEKSIQKVQQGIKTAKETAASLDKIASGVVHVTGFIASIASASDLQATAVEQVNNEILNISQVAQNNAAVSEESAAASEELSGQAACLKESVGAFKL